MQQHRGKKYVEHYDLELIVWHAGFYFIFFFEKCEHIFLKYKILIDIYDYDKINYCFDFCMLIIFTVCRTINLHNF